MATYRNVNHSLIYVMLAMVVICCLSIAGPFIIRPAMNNVVRAIALQEFETAFQEVQHPVGTESLSLRTTVGDFADSEQGCDFYVGEVRSYDGNEDVILAVYAHQVVRDNPIQVLFLEGGEIPVQMSHSLPEPLNDLMEWGLPSDAGQSPLYMVYVAVVGYEGDLGLDCQ